MKGKKVPLLICVGSGIGNVLLATPLIVVISRSGFEIDLLIDADYDGVAELFRDWSSIRAIYDARAGDRPTGSYAHVLRAVPPFVPKSVWGQRVGGHSTISPPPARLFYSNEQSYYLEFARAIGCQVDQPPYYFLPLSPFTSPLPNRPTLVLAPGSKGGVMRAKRWPFFPQLASLFQNVVVVGTLDDLILSDGTPLAFPSHVQSLVGQLTLRATAEVLAGAGVVVSNDSGLGHIAGALGVPTILIFGPTPSASLGQMPPNVRVLRAGLTCEPCWFSRRYHACNGLISCLENVTVEVVRDAVCNAGGVS